VRHRASLVPVTGDIPDDPAVAAVLDSLWAPHAAKYDEVLATATADFANRGDDLPQNALYADLVRAELGVELAFEGTGGVHWPLVAGPVTRGSLVDLDQDAFTVLTFRARGAELRRLLERVRPVPSGLRYRLFLGRLEEVAVGGAPVDDARLYSCAASSYLADRLAGLDLLERLDTGRGWAGLVHAGLRRAGTVTPVYDARRVVVDTLPPARRD
jgi:2',3'-cyclic-nucleotide 2'-phosphodiesterase (5'-nucleotidase family)